MANRKQKAFNYNQDRFVEGYVPADPRPVTVVSNDEVISFPIVVNQISYPIGINQVQKLSVLSTALDGDLISNDTFDGIPLAGTQIFLVVDGEVLVPADGASEVATSQFYVTDYTGAIIRTQGTFEVGDVFRWNGSVAGFQLEPDDTINVIYQI